MGTGELLSLGKSDNWWGLCLGESGYGTCKEVRMMSFSGVEDGLCCCAKSIVVTDDSTDCTAFFPKPWLVLRGPYLKWFFQLCPVWSFQIGPWCHRSCPRSSSHLFKVNQRFHAWIVRDLLWLVSCSGFKLNWPFAFNWFHLFRGEWRPHSNLCTPTWIQRFPWAGH